MGKLGHCNIDDIGAEFIGSMDWPNLQQLYLGNNLIKIRIKQNNSSRPKKTINEITSQPELIMAM